MYSPETFPGLVMSWQKKLVNIVVDTVALTETANKFNQSLKEAVHGFAPMLAMT